MFLGRFFDCFGQEIIYRDTKIVHKDGIIIPEGPAKQGVLRVLSKIRSWCEAGFIEVN